MQPGGLDVLPVRAKIGTPCFGKIRVLRQDVLDGELGDRDGLLASLVFEVTEKELQAASPIEETVLQAVAELGVVGEPVTAG